MSEDLTKYEIEQINRVDAKFSETKQKTNQATVRFEEKFKQVALAIAQLYSTIGKRSRHSCRICLYSYVLKTMFLNVIKVDLKAQKLIMPSIMLL